VFIHNPKVAGSSVRNVLSNYDDFDNFFWHRGFISGIEHAVDKPHITMNDLSNTEYYKYIESNEYFVFGFVRNPYERIYSAYLERVKQWGETKPFNDFLADLNPINIRYDYNFIHFCPQHYFFYNGKKRIADFIGKMEKINESFHIIKTCIGLESLELPKINVSNTEGKDDYLSFYNQESLAIVNSLYEKDFLLFDYEMCGDFELDGEGIVQGIAFQDKYQNSPLSLLLKNNLQLEQDINELTIKTQQLESANHELTIKTQQLESDNNVLNLDLQKLIEYEAEFKNKINILEGNNALLQQEKDKYQSELNLIYISKAWKLISFYRKFR